MGAEITELLRRINAGEEGALSALMPLVYERLHALARSQRHRAGADLHTLDTTGLVHELYLDLRRAQSLPEQSRGQFFAYSATAMRHILVDAARRRLALKRGGDVRHLPADTLALATDDEAHELLAVDQALTRLRQLEPRLAQVIELRFFAGLDVPDTACALGCAERTVVRDWHKARMLLHHSLNHQADE